MRVTAWNNGKHSKSGSGYGFKISISDRDRFFNREWKIISLRFEDSNKEIDINIDKVSFWSKICRELISKEIGKWLIVNGFAPWPKGYPPKFRLIPIRDNKFSLSKIDD